MRILHIIRNLEIGGLERMAVTLAAEQCRRGHAVSIAEVSRASGMCLALPDGVAVFRAGSRPRAFLPGCAFRLIRIFRDFRPDIVHVHNTLALHHVWLASLRHPVPVVFTKHGMDFVGGLYRHLYRRPAAVACVSPDVKAKYTRLFPGMVDRLFDAVNGVGSGLHPPPSTLYSPPSALHTLRLLWVGRMSIEKNLPLLYDACREVRREFPGVRLQLLGDGCERSGLPSEDWIEMPGMVDDIYPYLMDADCFVLPSLTEGLPMALLEAGMAGLPVVVSRVGAMPTIVEQSGGGWVVEPGDMNGLAAVLAEVAGMPGDVLQARGEALRTYVESHYSAGVMADDYERVYAGGSREWSVDDGE